MLQKLREHLTLVLIGLLPLHALLVTVGTKALAGADAAPLPFLALWKEALLGVLLVLAAVEWCFFERERKIASFRVDRFDYSVLLLLLLSVVVTALTHGDIGLYLLGFKYDFVALVAFVILRRSPWSEWFSRTAVKVILTLGGVVAIYGLITLVLPMEFFRLLGYSSLHSLYLPDGPIASFQQIGGAGVRRVQSTFSGPNQLGIWLLLPWSFGIASLFSALRRNAGVFLRAAYVVLIAAALLLTFSRTAWIAAAIVLIVFILKNLPWRRTVRRLLRSCGVAVAVLIILAIIQPETILRFPSSREHIFKPLVAFRSIVAHPFGQGLGVAGPASNRVSDACVFLEPGSDAGWAEDRPDLCVFLGGEQVQPVGRSCTCPRIIENWYLQMGVEMGVLGFLTYLVLTVEILAGLASASAVFLPFLGVSTAALLLHAWEESAVAYTLWMLVAVKMQNASIRQAQDRKCRMQN